mmetsp:Transcript_102421/g.289324  ORF Transcript_102421/g.289324 Transcript_102421/m.289324 type:complete len:254 (+) Transcript_102421:95-856(+)
MDRCPEVLWLELELALANFLEHLLVRLAAERWAAAEEEIQTDAQRPTVNPLVVCGGIPRQDLGRNVMDGTNLRRERGTGAVSACCAEVDQLDDRVFHRAIRREEEVFRFHVAVADSLVVQVANGDQHLLEHRRGHKLRETSCLFEGLKQLSALATFHDHVQVYVVLERPEEFGQVGVVHVAHEVDLLPKVGLFQECLRHSLHRVNKACRLVLPHANDAERALAALFAQAVSPLWVAINVRDDEVGLGTVQCHL